MSEFRDLPQPEGYRGVHISIDELSPVFNPDGTVLLTSEFHAERRKEGDVILLDSNEQPMTDDAFGKVVKVNKENNTILVQLMD